jgi:hypothetical protein
MHGFLSEQTRVMVDRINLRLPAPGVNTSEAVGIDSVTIIQQAVFISHELAHLQAASIGKKRLLSNVPRPFNYRAVHKSQVSPMIN